MGVTKFRNRLCRNDRFRYKKYTQTFMKPCKKFESDFNRTLNFRERLPWWVSPGIIIGKLLGRKFKAVFTAT